MAFKPYCETEPPKHCEPEPCPPVVCEPAPCPPSYCPPPPPSSNTGGDGGNGGNTGFSLNQIAAGGDAGAVKAGNGIYLSTDGSDDDHGSPINVSALNGLGGNNILSPSIGGPAIGVGGIFERDTAG